MALLDVLQCNGADPAHAAHVAASLVKNKPRFGQLHSKIVNAQTFLIALADRTPSFIEVYGRGKLLVASPGCRRHLNISGLDAFDTRTDKQDGQPWNFDLSSDRRLAREIAETRKSNLAHVFAALYGLQPAHHQLDVPQMTPAGAEEKLKEGCRHLHFVISLCKLQCDTGRHVRVEHPEGARSWSGPRVKTMISLPGVHDEMCGIWPTPPLFRYHLNVAMLKVF